MLEVGRMVPVITHAVTNRLLFRVDVIYVLQMCLSETRIAHRFPDLKPVGLSLLSHGSVQGEVQARD